MRTDPAPHALQTPPFIYARGAVRPWDDAVLHVNTEAVRTGFHVFEGLKGFWQPGGGFGRSAQRHPSSARPLAAEYPVA